MQPELILYSFRAGRISIIEPRRREGHEGRRKKEEVDSLLPGREYHVRSITHNTIAGARL
ncbi:hypothetical protein Q5692_20685 [Microcoleus sp. C2C3]|uniref:hypothetical protein n=1 Tax=unclassified Microcoleus TaxID=2642155 RepID=UPI002FD5930D